MGIVNDGRLLVVSHTHVEQGNRMLVRIISARQASRSERRQFESKE